MTDEQDNSVAESRKEEPQGPVGGERLAQARREQQISVLEVAKELHLDEPKVRALERNEFDVLGAPVFAKGHLRKYAQLVGVNADDVFADYYQLTRSTGLPPIVVGRAKAREELSPGPWIAAIIVLLAAAAAYWWFAVRVPAPSTPSPASEQLQEPEQTAGDAAEVVDAADADAAVEADDTVVLAAIPADDPAAAVTSPDVEPLAAAAATMPESEPAQQQPIEQPLLDGEVQLTLSFSGDCWTEITAADGRRLFFNMGRAGRTVELRGQAPLAVLFGNADNVSVQVNGSDYSVPPGSRSGRTARLTIRNP